MNAHQAASAPSRLEKSLKQELRRMQRRAILGGGATPSERERMAQLRDALKRMDHDRFAAQDPAPRSR